MVNLTQKIFSILGVPAIALGISCSKPEDDGRCQYNDFGECVQTFSSSDGRYTLDVTYGNRTGSITQELRFQGPAGHDGSDGCFYRIEKSPLGGLRLLEHRDCPNSLVFNLEEYFEHGREMILRIGL